VVYGSFICDLGLIILYVISMYNKLRAAAMARGEEIYSPVFWYQGGRRLVNATFDAE